MRRFYFLPLSPSISSLSLALSNFLSLFSSPLSLSLSSLRLYLSILVSLFLSLWPSLSLSISCNPSTNCFFLFLDKSTFCLSVCLVWLSVCLFFSLSVSLSLSLSVCLSVSINLTQHSDYCMSHTLVL